ncbi:MAG TPA: nucleotide exchange factor GrpE [Candidatus Anammoximicrobium sp.]|nr:nucleotide exchange factor GrpE [Candidatus Anammoximicrobium sp.]
MSKTLQPKDTAAAANSRPESDAADATVGQPPGDGNPSDMDARDQVIGEVAAAAAESAAANSGPSQIEQLQSQLAEAEDRILRAHAELDNYRKRANRLLQEETKYAPLPLVRDLLPVVDNLERAIQSAEQTGGSAGLLEGVKMVAQELQLVLEQHHCRRIEAQGAAFDPHLHEAIAQIPSKDLTPGTVAEVTVTGYQLHDRIVRPAQVLVSTRPTAESPPATEDDAIDL